MLLSARNYLRPSGNRTQLWNLEHHHFQVGTDMAPSCKHPQRCGTLEPPAFVDHFPAKTPWVFPIFSMFPRAEEPLEALLLQSHWVSQLFLWGCSRMTALAAVVVPSDQLRDELKKGAVGWMMLEVSLDHGLLNSIHLLGVEIPLAQCSELICCWAGSALGAVLILEFFLAAGWLT